MADSVSARMVLVSNSRRPISVLLPSSTLPQVRKRSRPWSWIEFGGGHQKYPSFLRCSIEASVVWSSRRVAPRSVMVVVAVSAMILRDRVGVRLDRGRAGDVADGAEAHLQVDDVLASLRRVGQPAAGQRHVDRHDGALADDHRAGVGEIDDRQFELLALDVLPDVELGPVRDREDADVLALVAAGVVEVPQFRALVLRVPLAELVAEAQDAFLGAGLFLVAAGAADAGVEAEFLDGFEQRHRLVLVARFAFVLEDDRAAGHRVLDRAHDQALAQFGGALVAEGDDFLVVVAGVDVQQREGELAGAEGLFGEAQHADRVLAAGEEQHRVGALAGHLAHDVDGLGFEPVEVAEGDFLADGLEGLGHCIAAAGCR